MQLSRGFTPNIQSYVLASEGGYVNHPRDPGKATNMGITIATLRAWRGTICLQSDPVTVECKTAVWQMYETPIACLSMLPPVQAFIAEQTAALPVLAVLAACKAGTVG